MDKRSFIKCISCHVITAVCASSCLNGGSCVAHGSNTYCACDPAYTGYRCEISELAIL